MQNTIENIVFYDGECGLCSKSIRFIYRNDPLKLFLFCPLQSKKAQKTLKTHNISQIRYDTVYVTFNGTITSKSDAAITVLKNLPKKHLNALGLLLSLAPKKIRDYGYQLVSSNRHLLVKGTCSLPPEGLKERILD